MKKYAMKAAGSINTILMHFNNMKHNNHGDNYNSLPRGAWTIQQEQFATTQ